MKHLTLETIPEAIHEMALQIDRIESILSEKPKQQSLVNKRFTLPEAARYTNMAPSTFRTYIYKRLVAGTKFNKAWIFLQTDLDTFIADFRRPTVKELQDEAFNNLNK